MTPRILNLRARPLTATEPCAPDVHYFTFDNPQSAVRSLQSVVAFDANTLIAVEISKAQHEALTREPSPSNPQSSIRSPQSSILFSGVRPKFDLSPDITCRQLTLHLSDQCNQRCKYCWVNQSSTRSTTSTEISVMSRQIAAAALEMIPRDGRDVRVAFFGGEPLLHFGRIAEICEMLDHGPKMRTARKLFHLTTNATLITPIVARFLADHDFSIIVSCDGPEKLHDAARGAGSHAAMMRGLRLLNQAGCSGRVVLRGTWSGARSEILQRLGALNALCEDGLAAGVALEPVAGAHYGDALDAEIHSACNWFGERARSGGTPRWQYLEKTLQRILWQQFRPSECGAGRGYYTVGPTGLIYACHKQQSAEIGHLVASTSSTSSTVVHIEESMRQKWLDNRFCARRECSLCWARHVCGGACRSESLEFCGSITEPHAGRCLLMRQLVAEALHLAATLPRETLLRICPALTVPPPFAPAGRTVSRA
jgi:uncharacterized protein